LFLITQAFIVGAKEFDDNTVIVIINKKEIFYNEIKPDMAEIQYYFDIYGKEISMQNLIHQAELKNLTIKLRNIIMDNAFSGLGIKVDNKEVISELDKQFKTRTIDKIKIKKVYELHVILVDALEQLQKNPKNSDYIYRTKLASKGISLKQWKLWKTIYNTPEKIKALQLLLPKMKTVEGMKKISYASTKKDIMYRKFRNIIGKNVDVDKEELLAYYEKKYPSLKNPEFSEIKDELREELLERKKYKKEEEWLKEQYKKAKIEIKNERFKDVLQMLIQSADTHIPTFFDK